MSCEINAGSFRNELIIEQVAVTDDGHGGRSKIWTAIKTLRVSVKEKSGNESFNRQNQNTDESTVFTTWHDPDIEADKGILRLNYKSKIYDLKWVNNIDGKDVFMELTGKLERMRTP